MPVTRGTVGHEINAATRSLFIVTGSIVGFSVSVSLMNSGAVDNGFVGRGEAVALGGAICTAIDWFWKFAYAHIEGLRSTATRLGALAIVTGGTALFTCASATQTASIAAGASAQHMALSLHVATMEQAVSAYDEAAKRVEGAVIDLNPIIGSLGSLAKAEFETGAVTGAGKSGAVYEFLSDVTGQLSALKGSVQQQQDQSKAALAVAHHDLSVMRATAGSGLPPAARAKLIGESEDSLREQLHRLDTRPLGGAIVRFAANLPSQVDGLTVTLSKNPAVRQQQQEALQRLRKSLEGTAARLSAIGSQLSASAPAEPPALVLPTPSEAIRIYWASYIPAWGLSLCIDLMPWAGWLWLFMMPQRKTTDEVLRDAFSMTVYEAFLLKISDAVVNGKVIDDETARAFRKKLLGTDDDETR